MRPSKRHIVVTAIVALVGLAALNSPTDTQIRQAAATPTHAPKIAVEIPKATETPTPTPEPTATPTPQPTATPTPRPTTTPAPTAAPISVSGSLGSSTLLRSVYSELLGITGWEQAEPGTWQTSYTDYLVFGGLITLNGDPQVEIASLVMDFDVNTMDGDEAEAAGYAIGAFAGAISTTYGDWVFDEFENHLGDLTSGISFTEETILDGLYMNLDYDASEGFLLAGVGAF